MIPRQNVNMKEFIECLGFARKSSNRETVEKAVRGIRRLGIDYSKEKKNG